MTYDDDGLAFDDGNLVPVTHPAVPGDGDPDDDSAAMRQEVLGRLIQELARGQSAVAVGRRVLLIAHLIRPDCTQAELAAKLGVSPAHVCQSLKRLRERLG